MQSIKNVWFKQLSSTIMAIIMIVVFCSSLSINMEKEKVSAEEKLEQVVDEKDVIVSYMEVFDYYYTQVCEQLQEQNILMPFTLEQFSEAYYAYDINIIEYKERVVSYIVENADFFNKGVINENNNLDRIGTYSLPSPGTAKYLLGSTRENVTSTIRFNRRPVYGGFDYSVIQEGDIVHESKALASIGHSAFVYNLNQASVSYGSYIQTIESVLDGGVQYGFLDDTRILEYGVIILRVKGVNDEKIKSAKTFCDDQVGKPYNANLLTLKTDIDSSNWYCSELIYAAYKNANIDIGVKKDSAGNDQYLSLGCMPNDIKNSYNTNIISIDNCFLDLSIVQKSGTKWTIKVVNKAPDSVKVIYNTKMCNANDAKGWTNLVDLRNINLGSGEYAVVTVSENWFATSIAFCWVNNNTRVISWGDNLNKNDKTLNQYNLSIAI